jgi:hypothetical protein
MMLLIDPSGKSLGLAGNRSPRHTTSRSHKAGLTSSIIVGPEKQAASEVHGLLLEAHPHADDANLARAAEITSSSEMIAHDVQGQRISDDTTIAEGYRRWCERERSGRPIA